MDEKVETGAGPALAAHSKDGSAVGQTSASGTTGNRAGVGENSASETVGRLSEQARDAAGRATASASEAISGASQRASDQITRFVLEQPALALIATAAVCFVLGVLIGRR
jgi:ElaB/YqjD/DUF883 family membrane-anchored ribosome-binding protein